jgi:formate hydrogenlyase subunit 4
MSPVLLGVLFVVLGPLVGGLVAGLDRIASARMQGRVGPPLLQPFYDVAKLLEKRTRAVNALGEPLLVGHVVFMALAGALLLGGTDLLFTAFVLALASLFLVLAAGSADSPYSFTAAERELIVMLASEPIFILLLAAMCKVTGQHTFQGVLASKVPVAAHLPGVLATFVFVVTMKLRKSPFDLSASHHAHQELVRGLTTDMSGRMLAYVEIAHWYETVLLGALLLLFFNFSLVLGLAAAVVVYLLEILVDNSTARAKWQLLVRSSWGVTLLLGGGNVLALYVLGR